jgi:hypothetical protein
LKAQFGENIPCSRLFSAQTIARDPLAAYLRMIRGFHEVNEPI